MKNFIRERRYLLNKKGRLVTLVNNSEKELEKLKDERNLLQAGKKTDVIRLARLDEIDKEIQQCQRNLLAGLSVREEKRLVTLNKLCGKSFYNSNNNYMRYWNGKQMVDKIDKFGYPTLQPYVRYTQGQEINIKVAGIDTVFKVYKAWHPGQLPISLEQPFIPGLYYACNDTHVQIVK